MSEKLDQATGVVTIALGWLTVALAPADALAWGDTLTKLAPFFLIAFLIWRMRQLDNQLKEARAVNDRMSQQLLLAYTAIKEVTIRDHMPSPQQFLDGDFNLEDCLSDSCKTDKRG
jgi:large-conductance mechanosensitive channel